MARYWVGGTGNWSDNTNHWSASSGGSPGASVPTSSEDVTFDTLSSNASYTVTVDVSASVSLLSLQKPASGVMTLTLQANITCADQFYQENGIVNANSYTVTAHDFYFYANTGKTPTINMGSGTWEATGLNTPWTIEENAGNLVTINAETSTVKITSTSSGEADFTGGGKTYYKLWFARGTSIGDNMIFGSNTFNTITDTGTVAHNLIFENGTNTTVTTFTVSGTLGNLITLTSDTTDVHTLTKSGSGLISCDYLNIQHSVVTPSSTWFAGDNSTNNQTDVTAGSGWNFYNPYRVYKSSLTMGSVYKSSGAQLIWNAATNTWADETGTWDSPGQVVSGISKSSITASSVTKS